jgi:hypothetical protein
MDSLRIFGFVMIIVLVIIGLDYYQQDKKHEGTLSANGYVDSIKHRFAQQQVERDAKAAERERKKLWKAGAKPHLPAAASGWTRYELTDADSKAVATAVSNYGLAPLISSISSTSELMALSSSGKDGILRKLSKTGAVYAQGDEIAWFDISLKPESPRNTLAGIALSRQQNFMAQAATKKGYAVIDGVAFIEITQDLTSPTEPLSYRKITGRIGIDEEVVIRLHTNASDSSIQELLGAVDYAALNALLTFPSPVVGQGYTVPLAGQPEVAEKMDRLYSEMILVQEKTSDEKLKNLDVTALVVNSMTASGLNSEGLMDITGGEVFENQDVLQIGYGRAQQLLLDSDTRQAALASEAETDTASVNVVEEQDAQGFFGRLKEKLPAFDSSEPQEATAKPAKPSQPVRVHKGGLGSGCAKVGSIKRCSVTGQ